MIALQPSVPSSVGLRRRRLLSGERDWESSAHYGDTKRLHTVLRS